LVGLDIGIPAQIGSRIGVGTGQCCTPCIGDTVITGILPADSPAIDGGCPGVGDFYRSCIPAPPIIGYHVLATSKCLGGENRYSQGKPGRTESVFEHTRQARVCRRGFKATHSVFLGVNADYAAVIVKTVKQRSNKLTFVVLANLPYDKVQSRLRTLIAIHYLVFLKQQNVFDLSAQVVQVWHCA
jgi:hypothetical protein